MRFACADCPRPLEIVDIKLLSRQPIPNAPVPALIHGRSNQTANREQATKP